MMKILDTIERRYGRYVPENITKILLIGQGIGLVLLYSSPQSASYFYVTGEQLLQGEIWRLVFILFAPISSSLLFVIFALYFLSNFFIFFSSDLRLGFRSFLGGASSGSKSFKSKRKPLHVCAVCGQNEVDNRDMEIRYCSECIPVTCYCGEHVKDHRHKKNGVVRSRTIN